MPNPFGAPERTVQEIAQMLQGDSSFLLLDVREPHEHALVRLDDSRVRLVPLSRLAAQQTAALPPEAQAPGATIVVLCHHGVRSAQVTAWLRQQGWTQSYSMAGGLDAWAHEIDPSIGTY